jgi:polyribonucleotide nucleotidyltransferase
MYITESVEIGGKTLTIETGHVARQANGAVTVRYGDTMVLVTAVADTTPKENYDFFPLSVEYREKSYAAGKIPGGFIKREGRPSEKEILSARLIDRPIRPLFPENFNYETQIIALIISMDRENDADVLAGLGASTALSISDIPFDGPIATVRVAKVNETYVVNPTFQQVGASVLEFIVAGSDDSIVMVEGEAKEISEEEMITALEYAHGEIKKLISLQKKILSQVTAEKRKIITPEIADDLISQVEQNARKRIQAAIKIREKKERRESIENTKLETIEALSEAYPESEFVISNLIHDIEKEETRMMMIRDKIRLDGRTEDEIRPITCQVGFLPRAHGSAIFTRGQTQALGTTTLGTKLDEQMIDGLEGNSYKAYMLHYNFPPFCTGEAKMIRGTSRREVGHGNLAERALKTILPNDSDFPYTIRVVSDILESNGSSSMATVCAGSLSLMDAGVPVRSAVAGIAMGLIKENDQIMILSDILGDEDHLGDMDFKVAGTEKGITAIQMDIKIGGISFEIMSQALTRAREGRLHILNKMNETLSTPRSEISGYAPRITRIMIPVEKIGAVIGPSGKTIKKIIELTDVKIDIDDDGQAMIASTDLAKVDEAINMINLLISDPKVGDHYKGPVKRITNFGAFVEIAPGKDGMIHISEIDVGHTKNITDVIKIGDMVDVIVKRVDAEGKIALSRKAYLLKNEPPMSKKE